MKNSCNARIYFQKAYYLPASAFDAEPAATKIRIESVESGAWAKTVVLSPDQLTVPALRQACPLLRFADKKSMTNFEADLICQLSAGLKNRTIPQGYYFEQAGAVEFADGNICFIRGTEVLGRCSRPYCLSPSLTSSTLMASETPVSMLAPLLLCEPLQVLLVLAYVVLTSIRSLVLNAGIDYQAVLYIVGKQGLGKTTLATRVSCIYQDVHTRKKVGFVQAGSTKAAIESLMLSQRDQPLVVDDLCLSAGKETERKRRELGAALIRQGSGNTEINKKSGKKVLSFHCEAGIILTAEFTLQNLSDLTRCLIVPVNEQLHLSDALTSELIGEGVRQFSVWFSRNSQKELEDFQRFVSSAADSDMDLRMVTNYACLAAAMNSFGRFLEKSGTSSVVCDKILSRMDSALRDAQASHLKMIAHIKESFPIGNIAFHILDGLKSNVFDLTKNVQKLVTHAGIMWKGDLCLRPESLVQFIRNQPGYHNCSRNKITRELKDLGALVIQEETTDTVHLKKGTPRVYRICIDALKNAAERY